MLWLIMTACLVDHSLRDGQGPVPGADDTGLGTADDTAGGDDTAGWDDTGPIVPCSLTANLELVPLDIWGRDLDDAEWEFGRDLDRVLDEDAGPGVVIAAFDDDEVDLQIILQADDHERLSTVLHYDGRGGFSWDDLRDGRVVSSEQIRDIDGTDCPVTSVYLGMDHRWFASTAAAPTRNDFEFLMDGEEFWAAVADDLPNVRRRLSWSTWWWMSDFELLRDSNYSLSESARWERTAMGMFEELDGVQRRVLINRFWDENLDWTEYLNTDTDLLDVAECAGDDFEVVLQGNSTAVPVTGEYTGEAADFDFGERVLANERYADRPVSSDRAGAARGSTTVQVASWHQKFMVFDGDIAFITGMNTKSTDWDTHDHLVYEPLRDEFDADADDRQAVEDEAQLPDVGPRKDYGARVQGPAAFDAERVFWNRWEAAIDGHDLYADAATRFELDDPSAEPAGGLLLQVEATMPEPWADMSIRETHAKAFANASDYIYIEDQYFRAPIMDDVIIEAMNNNPDLVLIVVSSPMTAWDGGAKWTYLADQAYRSLFGDRYVLLQLRSAELVTKEGWFWDDVDVVSVDMSTHSKLRLVDDLFLSLGSCNYNNRGYKFEGEVDVSVLDAATARAARERVFANLVGDRWADMLSDDPRNNLDVLAMAADGNQAILDWWDDHSGDFDWDEAEDEWSVYQPSGFVYPLQIDSDYELDVGPDLF